MIRMPLRSFFILLWSKYKPLKSKTDMKKLILLSFLCLPLFFGCKSKDDVCSKIEDSIFRKYCYDNFDKNKDGKVTLDEVNAVESINIESAGVTSLKGIENFPALTVLNCSKNKLTTLDISKNGALKQLICNDNNLTLLDVSQDSVLTALNCSGNDITTLDVSNNKTLHFLDCSKNKLSALDVSKNLKLNHLSCNNNPNLSELWLKTDQKIKTLLFDKKNTRIEYKQIFNI